MLITSIIKRQGGTHITMSDNTKYHFLPDENDVHCAEIKAEHVETLLAIKEGFKLYQTVKKSKK